MSRVLVFSPRLRQPTGSVWSLRTSWLLPEAASLSDRLEILRRGRRHHVLDAKPTVVVLGASTKTIDHELAPETHPGALNAQIANLCACLGPASHPKWSRWRTRRAGFGSRRRSSSATGEGHTGPD